jgi:hypothetical protein
MGSQEAQHRHIRLNAAGKVIDTVAGPFPMYRDGSGHQVWLPNLTSAIHGNMLYRSDGYEYEVQGYSVNGKLTRILRIDMKPRRTTKQDIKDRMAWANANRLPGQGPAADPERDWGWTYREQLPAIDLMLADSEGKIWLREGSPHGNAPGNWLVLDPDGRLLSRVTTPPGMFVHQIGRDFVLGSCRDEDGIQEVCMFGLRRN